jgi:hypothetical protein
VDAGAGAGGTVRIPVQQPPDVDELDPWVRHLCAPLTGRKIIVAFELLAGMTGMVQQLQRWGAQRPLLIADGRGTGPVPTDDLADIVLLDTPMYSSLTEQVRARMRPEERLIPEVVAAVEAYDPERSAAWWVSPVGLNEPMLARPVLGGRPRAQASLEDKLIVDDLLDAIGAARSSSRVAPASYGELVRATREVAEESGVEQVVWAGDTRDGINGGGDYVRWVRSADQAEEAAQFFGERCDEVRVSAFLEGVPCSVHGIVLPDGIVVLCPVELVNLLDVESGRFVYAGMGTTWSPPDADTGAMRDLARRLGRHLRDERDYRGAFGIDGVLTADGFRVTEVNSRFSGGLTRLHRAAPDAQLELVHLNALMGRDVVRPAADIETSALTQLDRNRFADVMGLTRRTVLDDHAEVVVQAGVDGLEPAESDDSIIGTVLAGPSALGSFFRFLTLDGILRVGERAAPLSVLMHEFANRTWDAGFPPALIAPDVRTRSGPGQTPGVGDVSRPGTGRRVG